MLLHVFTHTQAFLPDRFCYLVLQMVCMVEIFLATATLPYTKGFASLYFHQYCIPHFCSLMCLQMLHVKHLLYFCQFAGQNCLHLHFFIQYNVSSVYVWLSWFKGTLYICLCELHAHILCPSIRLLLFF